MSSVIVAPQRRRVWSRLRWLLGLAWAMEIHGYQSIYRFVFRRPRVPAGSVGFTYSAPILSILIVLTAVSAVELVVVDLIVHRWRWSVRSRCTPTIRRRTWTRFVATSADLASRRLKAAVS